MNKIYCLLLFFIWFYPALAQNVKGSRDTRSDISYDIGPTPMKPTTESRRGVSYYRQDGKAGFVDKAGNRLPAIYNHIEPALLGAVVSKDGLWGLVDRDLNFVVKPTYQSIKVLYDPEIPGTLIVQKENKFGLMNQEGKLFTKIAYDKIEYNSSVSKFIVTNKGLKGTLTKYGNVVLSTLYNEIFISDSASYSLVKGSEGMLQIIGPGDKAYPISFEKAIVYLNTVVVKSGDKYGAVWKDEKGELKTIAPIIYDEIYNNKPVPNSNDIVVNRRREFSNELIVVKDKKYGLIDNRGNVIYPVEYDKIYPMEGAYGVIKGNLYGAYFVESKKKLEPKYQAIDRLSSGTYRFTENNKQGLVGESGTVIIPPLYDQIERIYLYQYTANSLVKVKSGGKYGLITESNRTVLPTQYDFIEAWRDTLMAVGTQTPRKVGIIDTTGSFIIPADYKWIKQSPTYRSKTTVLADEQNRFHFVDDRYQFILPKPVINYGHIYNTLNLLQPKSYNRKNLMWVQGENGKCGVLNEDTKQLSLPVIYDTIAQRFELPNSTLLCVVKNKKYGIVNELNQIVVPFEYDFLSLDMQRYNTHFEENKEVGFIIALKGKKYGLINFKNQVIIPFQYTELEALSSKGLYKAKSDKHYKIVNDKNETVHNGPFDNISAFDFVPSFREQRALTFSNGMMKPINEKAVFVSNAIQMDSHKGYKTYEDMKLGLIQALEGDDTQLVDFVNKTTLSKHLIYFIKRGPLDNGRIATEGLDQIRNSCIEDLRFIKENQYRKDMSKIIRETADYTEETEDGIIVNSERLYAGIPEALEKYLKNSIKINGYWISSTFRDFSE